MFTHFFRKSTTFYLFEENHSLSFALQNMYCKACSNILKQSYKKWGRNSTFNFAQISNKQMFLFLSKSPMTSEEFTGFFLNCVTCSTSCIFVVRDKIENLVGYHLYVVTNVKPPSSIHYVSAFKYCKRAYK